METRRLSPLDSAVLAISAFAIVTSAILGTLTSFGVQPLPGRSLCWSQVLLHRDCAGCGLTRSFAALGGGHIARAFALNPLGPLLFTALAVIAIARLLKAATPRFRGWPLIDLSLATAVAALLLARLIQFYFL